MFDPCIAHHINQQLSHLRVAFLLSGGEGGDCLFKFESWCATRIFSKGIEEVKQEFVKKLFQAKNSYDFPHPDEVTSNACQDK